MKTFKGFFILCMTSAGIATLLFNPALGLFVGIVLVAIQQIIGEASRYNSKQGRKQIRKEIELQRRIEREVGTVEYWEDK